MWARFSGLSKVSPGKLQTLIIVGIVCANIFVVALSAHSLQQSRQQAEWRARTQTQNMAQAVDQNLSSNIDKIDLALRSIVDELERQLVTGKISPPAINGFLEKYQQNLPEVEALRVANAEGIVLFGRGVNPAAHLSWADRENFIFLRDHPDAGLRVSKPFIGHVAKTPIIAFTRRYNHPDGSFAGTVAAPVLIDHFASFLSGFDLGPNGALVLRDADIGLIARSPAVTEGATSIVGNTIVSAELRELAGSGVASASYFAANSSDEKERIISFRRIAAAPMMVLAGAAKADYLADWYIEAYKTAAWIASFVILSLLSGGFMLSLLRRITDESLNNKLFLRYASDGVHILDAQGNIIQASDQFCAMLGYTRKEVIGMNVSCWDTRWNREILSNKILPKLLNQSSVSTFETSHRRKDGELIEVEVNVACIDLDGKKLLYAASRDISERKRQQQALQDSEAQLRQSEERYRLLLKNSPVGILHYNTELIVTYANDRFEEIMQIPEGHAMEMDCAKLRDQSVVPPMRQAITGQASHHEGPYRTTFGQLDLWISMDCAPLSNERGEILGGIAIIEDITARKRTEAAEQRQRESLRSLNQISAFSHLPISTQLQQALSIGAIHLGLEFGIVSHIAGDTYTIMAQVSPPDTLYDGQTFPFDETYCQITIEQHRVVAISEMSQSPHLGHPCYQAFKLEAYIGAPVIAENTLFGTVNFSSPKPFQRLFDDGDKEFVGLLARWIGSAIERDRAQVKLAASEERLHAIIENEPECVNVLDPDGKLIQMNRAGLAMLEADSVEEINASGLLSFIAAEHRQAFIDLGQEVLQGESGNLGFEVIGKHGTRRWLETHAVPLRDSKGSVVSQLAIMRDITERRRTDSELRLAASVFNHAHEGIVICDADKIILEVNPTFTEITGYDRTEAIGQTPKFLGAGAHEPAFYAVIWEAVRSRGFWEGEIWNQRKDGTTYAELLNISQVCDQAGVPTHYIGTFSDISAIKAHQAQLEHLAHFDVLTNLPNRALLSDRMQQALAQARRTEKLVAVGYLDLDGFKPINDEFGHDAGDALLIEIGRRLKNTVRTGDTVARLGGDEFALLLLGINDIEECRLAAIRILEALAAPIDIKGNERRISGSLGITLFPTDDRDPDTLLRHADQAMYIAKQQGKNRYQFAASILDADG